MRDAAIALHDGRRLAYVDIGEPEWPCLIFFHGAPSSRLRLCHLDSQFREHRLRLIAPDRPGYGGSSPLPARTMSQSASDVAALADAVGARRFIVAGHSSGGPYALACAALLPDRVVGTITLGGVTDVAWPAAWDGFLESEAQLMRVRDADAALAWCVERFGADGSLFFSASGIALPEPDGVLYGDAAMAPFLRAARAEAFRQGVGGYAQDIVIQGRPWPFDSRTIVSPVHVLHGEFDTLVPLAHSRHTAELLSNSTLRVLSGHGHFTILDELPRIAAALAND